MSGKPSRVMIVEADLAVCGLVVRWVKSEASLSVVATVRTGLEALTHIERTAPDVILFGFDPSGSDRDSALDVLLARSGSVLVGMIAASPEGVAAGRRAVSAGVACCVAKPAVGAPDEARRAFVATLLRLTGAVRPGPVAAAMPGDVALRPFSTVRPRVVLIGSSTGGPDALQQVVTGLGQVISRVPVLVVQHMPPGVTTTFAARLARASGHPAREPDDGASVVPGTLYLAPGGFHMLLRPDSGRAVVVIDDGPPRHFCKPAVDPLFSSAVAVYGGAILCVVLTGMGSDGALGAADVVAAGGSVIAQDAATSVVWGMPGAVANAGLCSAVLPLPDIAPAVTRLVAGSA